LLSIDYDYENYVFPTLISEEEDEHWESVQRENDYWPHENSFADAEKFIIKER